MRVTARTSQLKSCSNASDRTAKSSEHPPHEIFDFAGTLGVHEEYRDAARRDPSTRSRADGEAGQQAVGICSKCRGTVPWRKLEATRWASWKSLHASAVEDLLRRPVGGPLAQLVRAHG